MRLQALSEKTGIEMRRAETSDRGKYLVFSTPTVLLLNEKEEELHRESGFIDFSRLESAIERNSNGDTSAFGSTW